MTQGCPHRSQPPENFVDTETAVKQVKAGMFLCDSGCVTMLPMQTVDLPSAAQKQEALPSHVFLVLDSRRGAVSASLNIEEALAVLNKHVRAEALDPLLVNPGSFQIKRIDALWESLSSLDSSAPK
jgi:hypothetical protein